jgi:hypothetical protein
MDAECAGHPAPVSEHFQRSAISRAGVAESRPLMAHSFDLDTSPHF